MINGSPLPDVGLDKNPGILGFRSDIGSKSEDHFKGLFLCIFFASTDTNLRITAKSPLGGRGGSTSCDFSEDIAMLSVNS